jgi:predicted PurR-regulated permease PerM
LHRAPEFLPQLQDKLAILRRPIGYLEDGLKQLESIVRGGGQAGAQVAALPPSSGLSGLSGVAGSVFSGTAATLVGFFTTMVLLFFLLASGDRLLRGLVDVLPRFGDKRRAVEIAAEVESNIARYLLTITGMNILVGIATAVVMRVTGIGDAVLWGVVAFCLNYIPILGPFTGVVIFFAVGFLSFASPWYALLPAGCYLLIHIAEGETITPMLLARRFTLNPVLVIVSLFFWDMIWGVPGALLAVPLLAITKIFCDHLDPLKPLGHLIGS